MRVKRKTTETEVEVEFKADKTEIETGIPFFNHMLETLAKHLGVNLVVKARGDDIHHVIEDVAICLGRAISEIDKRGLERFGDAIVPMDDSVTICGVDFSGRGVFVFEGDIKDYRDFKAEDFLHFFDTLCRNSGINAYMYVKGKNSHHMIESAFKAFAIALKKALRKTSGEYRSVKGLLD